MQLPILPWREFEGYNVEGGWNGIVSTPVHACRRRLIAYRVKGVAMTGRCGAAGRWVLPFALALVLGALPATRARAQMYGFGYGAYGVASPYGGFNYGYPAVAFGLPYPRVGFGYGYGGYGYSYPIAGYSYAYPGLGYSGLGYGYGAYPYVPSYATSGAPYVNPLFGVGLSPLGVNSALSERYMLGRSTGSAYSRSYAPVGSVRTAPPSLRP